MRRRTCSGKPSPMVRTRTKPNVSAGTRESNQPVQSGLAFGWGLSCCAQEKYPNHHYENYIATYPYCRTRKSGMLCIRSGAFDPTGRGSTRARQRAHSRTKMLRTLAENSRLIRLGDSLCSKQSLRALFSGGSLHRASPPPHTSPVASTACVHRCGRPAFPRASRL